MMFVLLVGAATFDSWPRYGQLLSGGRDVTLNTGSGTPVAAGAGPSLLGLLKGGGSAVHGRAARGPVRGRSERRSGGDFDGDQDTRGGTAPQSPDQNAVQPSGPSASPSGNVVQQAISNVGNVVESDTSTLGDDVGASTSPQVGEVVTRVGGTLNDTLQKLAGSR